MNFSGIKSGIRENKANILSILFIILLAVFFFHNFLGTDTLMNNGHHLHEQSFFSYNYKYALEYGTLPFWTPFWYGGQPLYGDSQVFFLNLTYIFTILFRNIIVAINLSVLIYFAAAGIGMYFLVRYLTKSKASALISSAVYMFNGLIYGFITSGNPSILEPYSLIPLIFLCILKAKKSANSVSYSIIAGMLLAFQIFSGGSLMLIYTGMIISPYLLFDLINPNIKANLIKTVIISITIGLVFFGLSAVKLLPNYEFIGKTNRASGLSYAEYIGEDRFILGDFFNVFVVDNPTSSIKVHLGIAAFLLVISSLGFWRRKIILFLLSLSILVIILASGGFLAEFFYKYVPTFAQTRHIARVLFVVAFAASLLAGYGFLYVSNFAKSGLKLNKKMINIGFIIILFIILTELVFLKGIPKAVNIREQLEQNQLANYLARQKEHFRVTTFDVDDLISFYGSSYYAQYGLETLSGGGGLWINDFIRYLAVAKSQDSSKLLGIINLRYASSTKQIEKQGFKPVKKFEECIPCKQNDWTVWIDGPYLYENENFLPRYYSVDNAILVVGQDQDVQNLIYIMLLNKNFDPQAAILVNGMHETLGDYDISFLEKFNAVIMLGGKIDQAAISKLQDYKNSGGIIFPDLLNQKNEITISELENFLSSLKGNLAEAGSKTISNNEIELTPKKKGFLVLSEKFSLFDGWKAMQNGKNVDILRADNVISAVYLDSPDAINFKFTPKTFKAGAVISIATILSIFILFSLQSCKKKKYKRSC